LIILTVGSRPRELDPIRDAVILDRFIHENAIIVGIET
jgi:hypothetical protein